MIFPLGWVKEFSTATTTTLNLDNNRRGTDVAGIASPVASQNSSSSSSNNNFQGPGGGDFIRGLAFSPSTHQLLAVVTSENIALWSTGYNSSVRLECSVVTPHALQHKMNSNYLFKQQRAAGSGAEALQEEDVDGKEGTDPEAFPFAQQHSSFIPNFISKHILDFKASSAALAAKQRASLGSTCRIIWKRDASMIAVCVRHSVQNARGKGGKQKSRKTKKKNQSQEITFKKKINKSMS